MNRPQRIWIWFALFLTLACGGLGWLTRETLELDRAEAIARREAEQEERVRLALWRMDALLMPLLVQEASRPDFVYSATHLVASVRNGKETQQRTMSPLLEVPPEFVRLHFQLAPNGRFSSPQAPQGEDLAWSLERGVAQDRIDGGRQRLDELKELTSYEGLLAHLPATNVGASTTDTVADANAGNQGSRNAVPQAPVVESFAQQQLAQAYNDNPNTALGQPANVPSQNNPLGNNFAPNNYVPPNGPGQNNPALNNPFQGNSTQGNQAPNDAPANLPSSGVANFLANITNESRASQSAASQAPNGYGSPGVNRSQGASQARAPNTDLSSRNSVYLAYASKASSDNSKSLAAALVVAPLAVEGVSRPLWVGSELVLARRVERSGTTYVQGCWLDWPALRDRLRQEVFDVLPEVELYPAGVADVARSLATLPVQLATPAFADDVSTSSPIRWSLTLAWLGLLIAATAAAVTLASVIALSERRAAFVAAVTHELRTPLTTFRMYAEMLSGGMVPSDSQPAYLETLRVEADRLGHLVDNVLQYARLERGRRHAPRETVDVSALVERFASRLASRAEQAGLRLDVTVSPQAEDARMTVDAGALEQILFNLVDNACKYAAHGPDSRLHLDVDRTDREMSWRVRDHGPGLPASSRKRLFQPFSKTVQEAAASAPGVGLGLALSHRLAQELGGSLRLERSDGDGAVFIVALPFLLGESP